MSGPSIDRAPGGRRRGSLDTHATRVGRFARGLAGSEGSKTLDAEAEAIRQMVTLR